MQIEIIDHIDQLPRIKQLWKELCTQLQADITPFSSYEWYETWWRHYSANEELFVIIGRKADQIVGIAPFMRRRATLHGLPARVVCFIENNESFLNDFIVLPEVRGEFLRALLQIFENQAEDRNWDMLVLNKLSVASANFVELVKILAETGQRWQEKPSIVSSYINPSGSWAEYWSSRSTRTRKSLRQVQNRIEKAGSVSIEHIETFEGLENAWDDICQVARHSWTAQLGESLASPVHISFYKDLAKIAAEQGWLSVWTLRLDGKMLAIEFHLRGFGNEYAMRGHFLPDDPSLSPGTYLELQILKHVFSEEDRLGKYDMGDFYDYKRKWSDSSEEHMMLSVYSSSFYARLLFFHEMKTVPLLRKMIPQHLWQHKIFKIFGIKTAPYEIRQR